MGFLSYFDRTEKEIERRRNLINDFKSNFHNTKARNSDSSSSGLSKNKDEVKLKKIKRKTLKLNFNIFLNSYSKMLKKFHLNLKPQNNYKQSRI